MRVPSRSLGLSLGLSLLPALALAQAPEAQAEVSIADVKLGAHWYGPSLKTEDLKGRVVLVEFWGMN